jgi:hypothetical protein
MDYVFVITRPLSRGGSHPHRRTWCGRRLHSARSRNRFNDPRRVGHHIRIRHAGQPVDGGINLPVAPGGSFRYSNVATIDGVTLDARVTFVEGSNLKGQHDLANPSAPAVLPTYLAYLDGYYNPPKDDDKYLFHQTIRVDTAVSAFAAVRIEFFRAGTTTPQVVSNLTAHTYDIDFGQGIEVDRLKSYTLSNDTILTSTVLSSGAVLIAEPTGTTATATGDGTAFSKGRVTFVFAPDSVFTYRLRQQQVSTRGAEFEVDFSPDGKAWPAGTQGTATTAPALLSPSTSLISGTQFCPISMTPLVASNFGGPVTYSVTGTTPSGITLSPTTGVFSGSTSATGTWSVSVSGTSGANSSTVTVNLDISASPMTLSPATQTVNGASGSAITATSALTATNPCTTVTYEVTSGELPEGLSLDPATGAITGTPTQEGSTTITVTAFDAANPLRTATSTITFSIVALAPPSQTVTGLVNCPVTMTPLVPSNFSGTPTFSTGSLPTGITLDSTTGLLSGSTSATTSSTVLITGTSGANSATAEVTFAITDPAMTLAPATQSAVGGIGRVLPPTEIFEITDNCGTVTYSVTEGSLPPGLTLNVTTGAITGRPTGSSSETVTITATDDVDNSRTATATVTFNIPELPVPPTETTTPTPPSTTDRPLPVPNPQGVLPALGSTEFLVTENGVPVDTELVVENDSDLVLRNQAFELRLRGSCTTGCTIVEAATGRETIYLDRSGNVRVSGFGFLPGSTVHVWIFSEPHYLGALLVQPDGTYEGSFPLVGIEVGNHTLQANGLSFDNALRSANLGIVVADNVFSLPAAGRNTTDALMAFALIALGVVLLGVRRRIVN